MTDIALHQLPDAGPLTGLENVPMDDGSATVKTTVSALRAGLAAASHTHPAAEISDGTPTGRSLMISADASAARMVLGLGDLSMHSVTISNDTEGGLALRNVNSGSGAAYRLTLGNSSDHSDAYIQINGAANGSHGGARSLNMLANAGDICFLTNRLSPTVRLRVASGGTISVGSNPVFDSGGLLTLRSYTVATLPTATPAGRLIHVSDGTSNRRLAVSDGGTWRWPDGTPVS